MTAIDDLFARLRASGRKAFMPFVTAGDPTLELTMEALRTLDAAGASMCEIGMPYSDPIADGPVIQASYQRALERKIKLDQIFGELDKVSRQVQMPLVAMASYSILHRRRPEAFVEAAQAAGLSGVIVPDLLVEEAAPLRKVCTSRDFNLIQLVTPTTPRDRQLRIAESSTGFLYFVSVTGITGERTELPASLIDNVAWLREQTELPICIGFGISKPEHVSRLAPVADGVIVGSAFVRRLATADPENPAAAMQEIRAFAGELLEALDQTASR